jgi:uncharacterized membrane protein YfcA
VPDLEPWQWAVGAASAFLLGVAKTGMPGVGILSIPAMVLMVGDARHSAAWTLPILCVADLFAVYYWRKHAAAGRLFALAPWVLGGVAAGAVVLGLHERTLRPMVGVIVLLMLGAQLRRQLRPDTWGAGGHGPTYGVAAGFSTTVANAAGPVMNLYLLSHRLPKEEFIATGAWFFFFVNLSKIPIYWWHGLFSLRSLAFDAAVTPAIVAGALTGRWLFRHIPQRVFDTMVIALTAVAALLLLR